jgi:hypothetical protein
MGGREYRRGESPLSTGRCTTSCSDSAVALPRLALGAGASGSVTSGARSADSALAATRASRRPFTYARQCSVHIVPRPSLRLGCLGNSAVGASWGSMPKRALPAQRRSSVLVAVFVVAIVMLP